MVGHEFDLSLCGQSDRRIRRRQVWEDKRQDADSQRQAERLAATDDSMISAACRELQIMKGPPPRPARRSPRAIFSFGIRSPGRTTSVCLALTNREPGDVSIPVVAPHPRFEGRSATALTHVAMKMAHHRVAAGLVATSLLLDTAGGLAGEKVQVKWNGNYPHNNERTFSESYRLGWSKNFMNGFPEENGVVQRDGFLPAELFKPKGSGPFHVGASPVQVRGGVLSGSRVPR